MSAETRAGSVIASPELTFGMTLPFRPVTMTFTHVSYFVNCPPVRLVLFTAGALLQRQPVSMPNAVMPFASRLSATSCHLPPDCRAHERGAGLLCKSILRIISYKSSLTQSSIRQRSANYPGCLTQASQKAQK